MKSLLSFFVFIATNYISIAQQSRLMFALTGVGYAEKVICADNGKWVVSVHDDVVEGKNRFILWDRSTGSLLQTYIMNSTGNAEAVFDTQHGELILLSGDLAECWNIEDYKLLWKKENIKHIVNYDSTHVLLMHKYDEKVSFQVADMNSGAVGDTLTTGLPGSGEYYQPVFNHSQNVFSIRSKGYYWLGHQKDQIFIYKKKDSKLLYSIKLSNEDDSYTFSNDDKYLICNYGDGKLVVFNALTGDTAFARSFSSPVQSSILDNNDSRMAVITSEKYSNTSELNVINFPRGIITYETRLNSSEISISFCKNDSALLVLSDTAKCLNVYHRTWEVLSFINGADKPKGEIQQNKSIYALKMGLGSFELLNLQDLSISAYFMCVARPVFRTRFNDSRNILFWDDRSIRGGTPEWLQDWGGGYAFYDQLLKWDIIVGKQKPIGPTDGTFHSKIEVSFDGKYALAVPKSRRRVIYDTKNGETLCTFIMDSIYDYYRGLFSDDGTTLVYKNISKERSLHLYRIQARDTHTGNLMKSTSFKDFPDITAISPDGRYMLLHFTESNSGDEFRIVDLINGKVIFTEKGLNPSISGAGNMAEEDEEKTLFFKRTFFALKNNKLQKFIITNDTVTNKFSLPSFATGDGREEEKGWLSDASEKYLFTQRGQHLYLWDASTGAFLDSMIFPGKLDQYRFNSTSAFLFLLGTQNDSLVVCKWYLEERGKSIHKLNNPLLYMGNKQTLNSLSLSPDKSFAVWGSTNRFITIYDLQADQIKYQLIPLGQYYYITDPVGNYDGSPEVIKLLSDINGKQGEETKSGGHYTPGLVNILMHSK